MKKNITLDKLTSCFLSLYVFVLLFWDYTIVFRVCTIILFVLFFLKVLSNKKIKIPKIVVFYCILTIYFIVHTYAGFTVKFSLSIDYCYTLILNSLMIFSLCNLIDSKKNFILMLKTFIFSTIICMVYFLYQSKGNFDLTVNFMIFSDYGFDHNTIPVFCGLSSGFILYLYKTKKISNKLWLMLIPLFCVYILISGARKSLILFIFTTIIYILIKDTKQKNIAKSLGKIFAFGSFAVFAYMIIMRNEYLYNAIGVRFEGFINGLGNGNYTETSAQTRDIMFQTAIKLIKQKPFIGYGLFSFSTFPGSSESWCHNTYLELIVSGGVICALIYYLPQFIDLIKLIKQKRSPIRNLFILLLIYILLVHDNLSVSYLYRPSLLLLIFIDGYIFSIKHQKKI